MTFLRMRSLDYDSIMSREQSMPMSTEPRHLRLRLGRKKDSPVCFDKLIGFEIYKKLVSSINMIIFQFRVDNSIMSREQSMPMSIEPRHLEV